MNYKEHNLEKLIEWRSTQSTKIKNQIEVDLMTVNKPVLQKYYNRFGDWAMAEIYMQLVIALKCYNIDHPKMSFVGYWKQKLDWKLPQKNKSENTFIKLPYDADADEKEMYKNLEITSPHDFVSVYGDDKDIDNFQLSDDFVNLYDEESLWDN